LRRGFFRAWAFIREGLWVVYGFIWALFKRFLKINLPVPLFKKKTMQLYEEADVVVLPGGHFFTNFNGLGMTFSHFFAMMLAFAMEKPTMIYAQTVGPFFGKFKLPVQAMTDFIIRHVDAITLREKGGLSYCKTARNVQLTAETVFTLDTDKSLAKNVQEFESILKNNKFLVGLTIHHIYYRYYFSREKYVAIMSEIMKQITKDFDAFIVIIPMEEAVHSGGDRPLAQEMIEKSGKADNVHILQEELTSYLTEAVIANTDIFIGTKTHSIVYGLKGLVPTISISYQDKSNQFMKMFNVSENAIDMKKLTVDDFMKIFARVYNSTDLYRTKQTDALPKVKRLAEMNIDILLGLLRN
jgi:colanic acid/amylovoran biosynthesis protein